MQQKEKTEKRQRRHKRVRTKIKGSADCPRISVFRSNKRMIVQIIDDLSNKTILQMDDVRLNTGGKMNKTERAYSLGKKLAQMAGDKKIKKVVFDRGGYSYHGRVEAVAKGAREGGLAF